MADIFLENSIQTHTWVNTVRILFDKAECPCSKVTNWAGNIINNQNGETRVSMKLEIFL
jgi:hypothetical protein